MVDLISEVGKDTKAKLDLILFLPFSIIVHHYLLDDDDDFDELLIDIIPVFVSHHAQQFHQVQLSFIIVYFAEVIL
jgi:hypothetical protein